MRYILFCIFLFPFSVFAQIKSKGISLSDGNTITIMTAGNETFEIVLHGADCPENGQPYSREAKEYTRKLISGKTLSVKIVDTNIHNQQMAIVTLQDGSILNEKLLKAGYAWHSKPDRKPSWARYENEARTAKRGLWAGKKPVAPWQWAKTHSKPQKPEIIKCD